MQIVRTSIRIHSPFSRSALRPGSNRGAPASARGRFQLPRLSCALLRTGVPNMSTTTATNTTKLSTELADGCNLAVVINVRALQLRAALSPSK